MSVSDMSPLYHKNPRGKRKRASKISPKAKYSYFLGEKASEKIMPATAYSQPSQKLARRIAKKEIARFQNAINLYYTNKSAAQAIAATRKPGGILKTALFPPSGDASN